MKRIALTLVSLSLLTAISCDKDDNSSSSSSTTVTLPSTYNFENVSYTGQENRLDMLSEIVTYMKTGNSGTELNKTQLENMFLNNGYTWTNTDLNSSTKQLGNKVSDEGQAAFGNWFQGIEDASKSTTPGSNGTAGLVTSGSGTKTYLFNENGIEYAQLIEKGAMGAVFYYQATTVYFGDDQMANADNETVEAGKGTDMQHHWDEAFGYFGVPIDFASAGFSYTSGEAYDRFWAKYTNGRNDVLSLNNTLMTSFIKGREAINRKDYTDRDGAIAEVSENWEKISAATAIHYLNGAKADFSDDALRMHQLSEAYAFIWSLRFNPEQKLTDVQIQDDILTAHFSNLYTISVADINAVTALLSTAYGFDSVKDAL